MRPGKPVLELEGVSVEFGGFRALADVDLCIGTGERVALVGSSGAGKSTLLGLLNGTVRPTAGVLRVLGEDLGRLSPGALRRVQRRIGTIYQQFNLVEPLAVVHNVNAGHLGQWGLARSLLSLAWPQGLPAARRALGQVGIADKLFVPTATLSGGEKQRVALARVLVQQPEVILADEPISNLDPERGRELMDLLGRLSDELGTTLAVSLHAVEYARSHFDRVVGLRQGRIVFDVAAKDLADEALGALYLIDAPAAA